MKILAQMAIILTISTIAINGVAVKASDILDNAKATVNVADVYQLQTALEFYYLDHNQYPPAADGAQMIATLAREHYIQNVPLDPSAFHYQSLAGGNDYRLTLK